MPDANVPIQPATVQVAAASVPIKVESTVDITGLTVLVQAVCLVDEFGRPLLPMSEATGALLLEAIKELSTVLITQGQGALLPSTRGLNDRI